MTLDIDDTVDMGHGHQQLSFFNAHYDERCFLPIHVNDTAVVRPAAVLLCPGKTPSGKEAAGFYAAHEFVRLPASLRLVLPMRMAAASAEQ